MSALHFLTGQELSREELGALLDRAVELKAEPLSSDALAGRTVAILFERPSTRTRVALEVAVAELSGHPMVLRADELQLSRGESLRDTAYVLSRHAAAIAVRTGAHALVEELARHSRVPVINMLSAEHHPTQALADLMTLREALGGLDAVTLAYVGDGNNVARSLALLGSLAGLRIRIASPDEYALESIDGTELVRDPRQAVRGANAVYTDVWVSMNDDPAARAQRHAALADYQLDDALLDLAAPGAIALHCLPAHLGEEITESVLYGDRQRIWDQVENRRHVLKALLELLVTPMSRI